MPVLAKLSTCGLPLGEEGHADHLIHSSWLLIRDTNLARASGKCGVVRMGCQWGKLWTPSIMQQTNASTYMIFKTSIQQGYHFPYHPE